MRQELKGLLEAQYKEHKQQILELEKKANAIVTLLGYKPSFESPMPNSIAASSSPDVRQSRSLFGKEPATGTPKGDMSWRGYALFMLREIGGKGKKGDVADAAIKANPSLDPKRVRGAIGEKLSSLGKDGVIYSERISNSLKDGNMYRIKENENKEDSNGQLLSSH